MEENQKKAINLLKTALEKAKYESADIPFIMGELFEETALETKSVLEEFLAENIEIFIDETIYSIEQHGTKYDNPEIYNYENETVYKDKLAKYFANNSNCMLDSCDTAFQLYQVEKQNKPIYNKVKDEIEKEYREKEIPNNDSDLKFEILMEKVSENFMKETLDEIFPDKEELNKGDLKELQNYSNEKLKQNESYTKKYSLVEIAKDRVENEKLKKEKKKDEEYEY